MFNLNEDVPIEMLRQFAVHFDADLQENYGAAQMQINNNKGEGLISLYELFPGLTVWIYDIKFTEDFEITFSFSDDKPYYFGFNISGFLLHKVEGEDDYRKIEEYQNFIQIGEPKKKSSYVISKNQRFTSCFIIVNPVILESYKVSSKRQIQEDLHERFAEIREPNPYFFVSDFDFTTKTYAELIIENKRTDLVGRLITEGAVMNMLASQIEVHDQNAQGANLQIDLTKTELIKITDLGDFIRDNISRQYTLDELSMELGLNEKKLQIGSKFLFGYSVNEYISNIRLEYAKELIYETDLTISEICYKVGYANRSYFSKRFKKRFGILPVNFKQSFKNTHLVFEISYRSIANNNVDTVNVKNIVEKSRKNNKEKNITGCLIFYENIFFQIIEGSKEQILGLYKTIESDPRHHDVQLMWKGVKPTRDFQGWDLALVSDEYKLNSVVSDGDISDIHLDCFMGEIDEESVASQNFWKKIRNKIKAREDK